jgi:peroxisomal 3,2-trans-enoyl-CoA isomerase
VKRFAKLFTMVFSVTFARGVSRSQAGIRRHVVIDCSHGSRCAIARHDGRLTTGGARYFGSKAPEKEPQVLTSLSDSGIYTIQMNRPKQLNAWTKPMMYAIRDELDQTADNDDVKVVILTGKGKYYCAGVNLSSIVMKPMHPGKLHSTIRQMNQELFDMFLDFKKPLICGMNGPAIGASVTSAALCDAIVASSDATLSTPFARLGLPPEGCSSKHFVQLMGDYDAQRMLGGEGWSPTAEEAKGVGLVDKVIPTIGVDGDESKKDEVQSEKKLMDACEKLATKWIEAGKLRSFGSTEATPQMITELKHVNANESIELADAFLSANFLQRQSDFLASQKKTGPAMALSVLCKTRPLWGMLLPDPGQGKT